METVTFLTSAPSGSETSRARESARATARADRSGARGDAAHLRDADGLDVAAVGALVEVESDAGAFPQSTLLCARARLIAPSH